MPPLMFWPGWKLSVTPSDCGGGGHELHQAAGSGAGDGGDVAAAFGVDDGGEEVLVDVVRRAGGGEELAHFDRGEGGGCGGDGWQCRCWRRWREDGVGEGFDADDFGGGDVLVVVVAARGRGGCGR